MATALQLPDSVAHRLGLPEPLAEARLRRTLALALYREGRLTLADACDLAGVREDEFPGAATPATEQAWLREHRAEYAGQWVALHEGHLLASARSAEELFSAVDRTGVAQPLFLYVEPADTPPFAGW